MGITNRMILVNNQLDTQFFMYVYFYSLHVSGSHVSVIRRIIVSMRPWFLSLCVDDRLVCTSKFSPRSVWSMKVISQPQSMLLREVKWFAKWRWGNENLEFISYFRYFQLHLHTHFQSRVTRN